MTILELAFAAYNIVSTTASIIGAIDVALKRFSKSTAENLFKESFITAVKQSAPNLAHLTETQDPKTVDVNEDALADIITSLKNSDISTLTSLGKNEKLIEITKLFHKCIILPGHQLTFEELVLRIRPILEKAITDFYEQLPFKQEAFNQILFELENANQEELRTLLGDISNKIEKVQLEVQQHLMEHTEAIKDDTGEIKKTAQATHEALLGLKEKISENRHSSVSIADVVAIEHQSEIDDVRNLLKNGRPQSALELLEKLKQRIWTNTSSIVRFRLLTNMAKAQILLNKEQEAAMLVLEAFQYNPKDEIALSNRAFAHFLIGETEEAEVYVQKTLEQNPANANAYAILVEMSIDEETLGEIIDKVPEYLRETSRIAYAIGEIARQRRNFGEARKWGEIMVVREQEDVPSCKAALAAILLEEVLDDHLAVFTNQLNDSQQEQLRRAIGLFTEAWDSVTNTELRTVRTEWIIDRSTAYVHLGELKEAIRDLDIALEIEASNPSLLGRRAMLAFEVGENKSAIGFLEKVQSAPETPGAPILLANILRTERCFDEAIKTLNDFLMTASPVEFRESANHLLINIYIAGERYEEAQQISTTMRELSPTSILNLVDAARISKATGEKNEALSLLKEAYGYAQNSDAFQEIMELANELYIYEQFEEAATLYEKFVDTNLNSQLTQHLLYSYYRTGKTGRALEICQSLREEYGLLKNISEMEFEIYNEIGDMNQARAVCEMYINAFPDDIDMQIRLAVVYSRSNKLEEVDGFLDRPFDLKNLSLRSCFDLAYLYRIRSKPEKALDIMYEARKRHYDNPDAHLKYIGLFFQVSQQIGESLHRTQVQPGTVVYLDNSGQTVWYITEKHEDADSKQQELDVDHPLARRLLGKTVNDEICLRQDSIGSEIGKITDIKSKYVYAFQKSLRTFSELFPDTPGISSIKLDDSHETDDSAKFQPLLNFITQQHEASLQIEEAYKENPLPIGAFTNLTGRNVLDTWSFLMNEPELGVRCNTGNPEERSQALVLLRDQPKLIVDLISLMTMHGLGVADTIIKAFGKLGIAQSTIDELQAIIREEEMWSKREGMSVGKQGDQYVRAFINPEDIRRNIEHLKSIIKWIGGNCEILTCNAMLQMNQLHKREFDDLFQRFFIDTLLIASQPGYLLLSDDELLRSYAKTNFGVDAKTNYRIDGVWTQVVLEYCVNKNILDRAEYNKMTIKLICSHYYHTAIDADVLIEAAKQSDWNPSEPYNLVIQIFGDQRTNVLWRLSVVVDFLFQLWLEPILPNQRKNLTFSLLDELTSRQETRAMLIALADQIRNRFTVNYLAQQKILSDINVYAQTRLS